MGCGNGQDVLSKGKVEPWQEYPTHSGEVEKGSFVAWPTDHMRPQQIIPKPNISETELLKDALHPDQFDSPGTIMSRDRQLRSRTYNTLCNIELKRPPRKCQRKHHLEN